MALNITDSQTDRLARELAGLTMLVEGSVDEILPVDATSATAAVEAWRRFGRARHPAGLNYRDCFAYALARQRGVPLLYTGDDFTKTDLAQA